MIACDEDTGLPTAPTEVDGWGANCTAAADAAVLDEAPCETVGDGLQATNADPDAGLEADVDVATEGACATDGAESTVRCAAMIGSAAAMTIDAAATALDTAPVDAVTAGAAATAGADPTVLLADPAATVMTGSTV